MTDESGVGEVSDFFPDVQPRNWLNKQKLTQKCRQICWFLLKWFQNLALEILCIIAVLVIVSKDRIKLNEL